MEVSHNGGEQQWDSVGGRGAAMGLSREEGSGNGTQQGGGGKLRAEGRRGAEMGSGGGEERGGEQVAAGVRES